jgi:hypothetical protein
MPPCAAGAQKQQLTMALPAWTASYFRKIKMVDKSGLSTNFLAFEELAHWGAIIEKIRSFPSYYGFDSK